MSILSSIIGGQHRAVLNERAQRDIFNDVTRAFGKRPPEVEAIINRAESALVKTDRISWFLRLWKIAYLDRLSQKFPDTISPDYVEKLVHDYSRRSGMMARDVHAAAFLVSEPSFLYDLQHLLTLPIPAIQRQQFSYKDAPDDIIRNFEHEEKEWRKRSKGAFEDPDATLLIRFPNGLAWYDLGRPSCEREAEAMGHNGNGHRSTSSDTILSLRESVPQADGRVLFKPVLTFVIDEDGMLGEMKGRFNQKPGREYHNEIVELLRHPMVQGIKGGGYKPENNFSLQDLDEETRQELLDEKPSLRGLRELYKAYGIQDARTQRSLGEWFRLHNIPEPYLKLEDHGSDYVLDEWSNLTQFAREADDRILARLLAVYQSGVDDLDALTADQIYDIINSLNDREYARLMRDLGLKAIPHNDVNYHRAVQLAADRVRATHYYELMLQSVNDVATISTSMKRRIEDQIKQYVDVGYHFRGGQQKLEFKTDVINDSLKCTILVRDLIDIITSETEDEQDQNYFDLQEIRDADGWAVIDWDSVAEDRADVGLAAHRGYGNLENDTLLDQLDDGEGIEIDIAAAASRFAKAAGL